MQLVERHIRIDDKAVEALCFKSARLYNFCNYYMRQAVFGKVQKFKEYELTGLLTEFNQEDYRELPAQTSQQIIKLLFKNWKSYWESIKEYTKHPDRFFARPRLPGYKKKDGYSICVFTDQQVTLKEGFIYFPKQVKLEPLKTKVDNICQVRVIPQATCFIIEVVYEKEKEVADVKKENVLSIDLGINNFVAAIDNVGQNPFIINGRKVKSINAYFNRKRAKLMSFIGNRGTSNRIEKLTLKRNNLIENFLHQSTAFIVKYCVEHKIGTVVIGKNENWKQKVNLGKRNNQNFVNIPHAKGINKLRYKLELKGILLIEQEESHTSKCDHLTFETIEHHKIYDGKRVKRGLFQSSTGHYINSDVNGALGIGLKANVFRNGKDFVLNLLDTGCAFQPIKLNVI